MGQGGNYASATIIDNGLDQHALYSCNIQCAGPGSLALHYGRREIQSFKYDMILVFLKWALMSSQCART